MKKYLLLFLLVTAILGQAQIFNRSKANAPFAVPFHYNGKMYAVDDNSIDEIDANGNVVSSVAFQADEMNKKVLVKSNGNLLVFGSLRNCDFVQPPEYYVFEYDSQLILVDSVRRSVSFELNPLSVLEISQNRLFVLSSSGYAVLNSNYDTLVTGGDFSALADVQQAVYLGGDSVLVYSQTWASSSPLYNLLNITSGSLNPWIPRYGGSAVSLSDSTFALVNPWQKDVFTYRKSNLMFKDSTRLVQPTYRITEIQDVDDGFVLRGDSGLAVYEKSNLSLRGSYMAHQPLNQGLLSVSANKVFFFAANHGTGLTNYHILEAGELNQPASNPVNGIEMDLRFLSANLGVVDSSALPMLVSSVRSNWKLSVVNNSSESLDSLRILLRDPFENPFCTEKTRLLKLHKNPLIMGDSLVFNFSMSQTNQVINNNSARLGLNVGVVMANGKAVGGNNMLSERKLVNNLSAKESTHLSNFSLYPNPAHNMVHIESAKAVSSVEIVSLQGEVVRKIENKLGITQIPVSEIPAGLYLFKVETVFGSVVRKVLVY